MTGLCTVADIRGWRGADDPNALTGLEWAFEAFILATSRHFEKIAHRPLARSEQTEYFDGNNSNIKYLQYPNEYVPIITPPAVVLRSRSETTPFTETLIPAANYQVFESGLLIYMPIFICPVGKYNYVCEYTMGFDCANWIAFEFDGSLDFPVPEDLRKAVAMQTALNLKKASGKLGDSRLGLLAKTGTLESESIESYVQGIEPEALDMIKQYIRVPY